MVLGDLNFAKHHYSTSKTWISLLGKLRIKWLLTHDIPRNGTVTVTLHHEFPHWTNTESHGYSYKKHHAMAQLKKHNSIHILAVTALWSLGPWWQTRVGSKLTSFCPKDFNIQYKFHNKTELNIPQIYKQLTIRRYTAFGIWWHMVTHGRGSEGERCEWSG